jgi:hypothetical protein
MAYNGNYIKVNDFTGGYCGNLPSTQLSLTQAADLDNIIILPNGKGFRTRLGNSKMNATAMNAGANVQGIGQLLTAAGASDCVTVCGAKVFNADDFDGTMHDISGSVTITAGADNHWNIFTFNNAAIGFGGPINSPDAPFRWTGTGNAAALGGTAKSAYGGFAANNRVFCYRTSDYPSTMFWSIIGDASDMAGAGSGSAVIGSLSDNQHVTGACVISTNYVLVFKENSTYQMVISSAPFPVYSLFDNVGAVGKNAIVNVDGEVYFITSKGEMKSTDGEELKDYPNSADDKWALVQTSRLPYINGFRLTGTDFDWIVWCVSTTGSTNNLAIVWDLVNKCWVKCSTGFKMNVSGSDSFGNVYMGGYDGFIYKPETTATYADASETTPGTITGYWQSGWINEGILDKVTQIRKLTIIASPKASGTISISYGFDGFSNTTTSTVSQVASSTENYLQKSLMITGRGNSFEYKIAQSSAAIDMKVQSIILQGKVYGQKGQAQD